MEVTHQGYLSRVGNSIKGALIGILLFFGSFVVLYINEGAQKDGDLLENATSVTAATLATVEGIAAVTGTVTATDKITGDADILSIPSTSAIYLERQAQTYAWVEEKNERTEENLGGSTTTYTTYTYVKKWVDAISDTSTFVEKKAEHVNLPGKYESSEKNK